MLGYDKQLQEETGSWGVVYHTVTATVASNGSVTVQVEVVDGSPANFYDFDWVEILKIDDHSNPVKEVIPILR